MPTGRQSYGMASYDDMFSSDFKDDESAYWHDDTPVVTSRASTRRSTPLILSAPEPEPEEPKELETESAAGKFWNGLFGTIVAEEKEE